MSAPTAFDLDVDIVPSTELFDEADTDVVRKVDEKVALTPGTVNTYALGIAMCVPCC